MQAQKKVKKSQQVVKTTQNKPWGGRFSEVTDQLVETFTASLQYDRRLYRHDIEGSIAHARMLSQQGIITAREARSILTGLREILADIEAGRFLFRSDDEDIHMAIEKALIQRIGETGGKLHTGRSRNDQVALDIRLYLREEINEVISLVASLKGAYLALAKQETETILPGYTHLQKAQPVLLAHYLLAFWEMLDRDEGRLKDCWKRVNCLPLGAGALAGTGLPIDRGHVAGSLGFPVVTRNSMDTVSDRDFVAEFIFCVSLIMMHLSRFCEDLILWSTDEFGYVEISDAFTTGSSMMPQKKNPDVAELIRGKSGRVYGHLMAILTILKGLPMTYNRDLQEDKEPLFDTVDTVKASLKVLTAMLPRLTFHRERMAVGAAGGFSIATDVAEYLVMKGVPFREAHGIVGKLVAYCMEQKRELPSLSLQEFQGFYEGFDDGVYKVLTIRQSVNVRKVTGGTSQVAVKKQIAEIEGL